ncbi:hypothetical protein JL722_5587 [Aureococcus anophagefferens]|nr:hypothetical protein JL722_5587 [Aureococcus anophagefferens]
MIGGDDLFAQWARCAFDHIIADYVRAFNHKAAETRHFRKLPSGHADAGGRSRDDGPAVHFDVLALYNGLRSETAAEHADHEHADRKRAKSFTARKPKRQTFADPRNCALLLRLRRFGCDFELSLGLHDVEPFRVDARAIYLCACLYFGAAASYGDTTAMRGGAAAAAPRALESPTAKEAAPVPENEDPRAQNKDLHAENEDLRERLAAAEASLELAKSRALEPAPRALEPARASYGDTTAMRGGAAAAPRVLTAREGRAPRSLDVYLIVAGVQKCGTSELQQWLKRLPRVRHNNLEPHFFDCLAGGPCDKRCVPGAFRPGGCHGERYVLNNETLDAYRRDFKPLAIAEGPKTRALEIADASGEALPWLHFEKTPSYYDCADSALVRATLPNARVAFILRDPVARLWSGYFHMHETRIRVAARRAWTAKFGPSATIPPLARRRRL